MSDTFKSRRELTANNKTYHYYSLPAAQATGLKNISRLPFSLKVLLENQLRYEDGQTVTTADIEAFSAWADNKIKVAAAFKTKTRAEWCDLMEGSDVCFGPVLDMDEAPEHPHNKARGSFVDIDGVIQAAPAPRFSATPGAIQGAPVAVGANTDEIITALGLDLEALKNSGAVTSA